MAEEPGGLYAMPVFWNIDPEILPDPDVVSNPIVIQVSQPLVPDKLPVSQKTVNTDGEVKPWIQTTGVI